MIARCRDLVHVWRDIDDADGALNITTRVGFLHRSVADFINLAEVEKKIDGSTAPDFDARTALGHAHTSLSLLILYANNEPKDFTFEFTSADETWKHECRRHMLKALQLGKDVKVYSPIQSRDILSFLTFAVFHCNSDDQQWEHLNRENADHHEVYAHSDGELFGPAQFLTLMINTIESADTSVIKHHVYTGSVLRTTNAIEGVLALLVGHFDEPFALPLSFFHIITSCLQPQRRLTSDENNEPTFESRRTYNLGSLARVLELAEAW
jgi:hypothetical protein